MTGDCLFCSIVAGAVPADVVLDEPDLLAFRDIAPQAPLHVLIIPKQHYPAIGPLAQADPAAVGALMLAADRLAAQSTEAAEGYRLVTNTGQQAGQTVDHVHVHLLAGRPMTWPPG